MSSEHSHVSEARARVLLSRVEYADRLAAGRLQPPVGLIDGFVRSIAELHMLLEPEPRGLPALDFDEVVTWVREVVRDEILADELSALFAASDSYVESCRGAYGLLGERLEQARQRVGDVRGFA